ncbi:ATP-binding protein [Limisalsivibrio acetivorans]|uniref:ATP-binding protein n=1 Tax=Limisalsivibrio acetivorans TaxID=1304888 RepID=UPI0003B6333D|nr:ATP-binding protein [Limisalsivibrio acetivorans]
MTLFFIISIHAEHRRDLELFRQNDKQIVNRMVSQIPKRLNVVLQSHINHVLSNNQIMTAFLNRDRERLARYADPFYKQFSAEFPGVRTVLQFHNADGTSLYRAHAPDFHSDEIRARRNMLRVAREHRKPVSGIEIGRFAAAQRYVVPVMDGDSVSGMIEVGIGISVMAQRLNMAAGFESTLLLKTENSDIYELSDKREVFPGYYELFNTHPSIFSSLFLKVKSPDSFPMQAEVTGKIYRIISDLQLTDFSGDNIGQFVFITDITNISDKYKSFLTKSVAASIILVLIILVLIRKGFNETVGSLEKKHEEMFEELSIKEKKYKRYMDTAPTPIFIINRYGEYLEVNAAAERLTEYSAEELYTMRVVDLWLPGHEEKGFEVVNRLVDTGSTSGDLRFISKTGRNFSMRVTAAAIDEDTFMGICVDTTEVEESKRKLEELNSELERLNNELTAKVQSEVDKRRRTEQLLEEQKKFADMGQMISAIAHQWRQPLNALAIYIQNAADDYDSELMTTEIMEEFEGQSMELIKKMSQTIDDFRMFFAPARDSAPFDIITEVVNLVNLMSAQMNARGVQYQIVCKCTDNEFEVRDRAEFPECRCSKTRLNGYPGEFKHSLLNIIYNALDSIEKNRKLGRINSGLIEFLVEGSDETAKVTVTDNGTGIGESIINKIFDPYFTTKEEGSGTGIGLYMTRMMVEKHMKGTITAKNNKNGGASIIMTFSRSIL